MLSFVIFRPRTPALQGSNDNHLAVVLPTRYCSHYINKLSAYTLINWGPRYRWWDGVRFYVLCILIVPTWGKSRARPGHPGNALLRAELTV